MKIQTLDLTIETPYQGGGVAYYRLPNDVMEFFKLCQEKHGVVGFEWDPEDPRIFGLILKENPKL